MSATAIERLNAALSGRYRIESELGEGGMATVYLADDIKHERKVALKVLKPELAAVVGAERFLAEIKTTANLTHPHILPLHDSGEADGFLFYVMPYVEGESLRDKLDREHQLPVDEAVRIATNVAEALDYAHRQGVIHRDIKPANILVQSGKPVLSDFGIALAVGVAGGGRLTETGLSLGTPHYMSPEQATGDLSVGAATDVYALGCVLYEMLVGEPPYTGSTAQAILGKIIAGKLASATEARASVPSNVDAAIRKALEKVPADRFTAIQDFSKALAEPGFRHGAVAAGGTSTSERRWKRISIGATVAAGVFALAFVWALSRPRQTSLVTRASVLLPEEQARTDKGQFDITPDGSLLIYEGVAEGGQNTQLWIRRLDALQATPIPGTQRVGGNGPDPVISPDGLEVAVRDPASIRVYPVGGGVSRTLVDDPGACCPRWSPDGAWIYYMDSDGGISRAPSGGGPPQVLTSIDSDEEQPQHVDVMPDGKGAVFQTFPALLLRTLDIASGEVRDLIPGGFPRYAGGYLFFTSAEDGRTLMVVPFDPVGLELEGAPVPIAEGLVPSSMGQMHFAISQTGTLLYKTGGGAAGVENEFVWVTRSGEATAAAPGHTFPANTSQGWRLSPDETRIAFNYRDDQGNSDIRIKHLPDGPEVRVTFSEDEDLRPFWTLDGQSVTYFSGPSDYSDLNVWSMRADGIGEPVLVLDDERSFAQGRWSRDGETLVLRAAGLSNVAGGLALRTILAFRPGVDSAAVPLSLAAPEFVVQAPALSADGRWLAYSSNEGGNNQVFVRPFPDVNSTKVRVSTEGGQAPVWAKSGSELFFIQTDTRELIAAQIDPASGQVLDRQTLFTIPAGYRMDPTATDDPDPHSDGERFLMVRRYEGGTRDATKFVAVLNLFEELKRLVPN